MDVQHSPKPAESGNSFSSSHKQMGDQIRLFILHKMVELTSET